MIRTGGLPTSSNAKGELRGELELVGLRLKLPLEHKSKSTEKKLYFYMKIWFLAFIFGSVGNVKNVINLRLFSFGGHCCPPNETPTFGYDGRCRISG